MTYLEGQPSKLRKTSRYNSSPVWPGRDIRNYSVSFGVTCIAACPTDGILSCESCPSVSTDIPDVAQREVNYHHNQYSEDVGIDVMTCKIRSTRKEVMGGRNQYNSNLGVLPENLSDVASQESTENHYQKN